MELSTEAAHHLLVPRPSYGSLGFVSPAGQLLTCQSSWHDLGGRPCTALLMATGLELIVRECTGYSCRQGPLCCLPSSYYGGTLSCGGCWGYAARSGGDGSDQDCVKAEEGASLGLRVSQAPENMGNGVGVATAGWPPVCLGGSMNQGGSMFIDLCEMMPLLPIGLE